MKFPFTPRKKRLMWRILKHYLVIIIALSLVLVYSQHFFYEINTTNATHLSRMMEMQHFTHYVADMYDNVQNYYNNPSFDYYSAFTDGYQDAHTIIDSLYHEYKDSDTYIYRDIRAILDTYYEEGYAIIEALDNDLEQRFYLRTKMISLERLKVYLHQHAYLGIESLLAESQEHSYSTLSALQTTSVLLNAAIIFFILLCIVFAYNISKHIATPVHQLSIKFQEVANGNLEIRENKIKNDDEINILINSFNSMVEKLKQSQSAIIQKAEMELQLQKEHMHNIEMENLLKESELKFLHMQINPHFLYNTLNSICSLSQIEGAETTSDMINSLSTLLRYTLNTVNEMVPMSSEIEIAKNYLFIQKTRFGPRLDYTLNIDDDCMNHQVPSMILQPLVENAIIHGLETLPGGGNVSISAHYVNDKLEIMVQDNGIGMSEETLQRLRDPYDDSLHDARRGIGITNVQKRLILMYSSNPMEITSSFGKGTRIRIVL